MLIAVAGSRDHRHARPVSPLADCVLRSVVSPLEVMKYTSTLLSAQPSPHSLRSPSVLSVLSLLQGLTQNTMSTCFLCLLRRLWLGQFLRLSLFLMTLTFFFVIFSPPASASQVLEFQEVLSFETCAVVTSDQDLGCSHCCCACLRISLPASYFYEMSVSECSCTDTHTHAYAYFVC